MANTNIEQAITRITRDLVKSPVSLFDAYAQDERDEESREAQMLSSARKWAVSDNRYFPCEKAVNILPAGVYTAEYNESRGIFFEQKKINTDELLILPDTSSDEVVLGIEKFWGKEAHYRKFNFMWKRGILLTGPPGSGKTSTVQIVIKKIISKNGLAIYVHNPTIIIKGLEALRIIEPHRQIVVILEDIDSIIDKYDDTEILALLDGELQVDNVVFIATTNYPETLDKRIKNRPSRFDLLKIIGMPSTAARKMFLELKNPRLKEAPEELALWVKETDGFSIAHLKEVIISVEVLELSFEDTLSRLKAMISDDTTSNDMEGRKLGFGS